MLINTYKRLLAIHQLLIRLKSYPQCLLQKEIVSAITVSQPDQTLMMRFSASAATAKSRLQSLTHMLKHFQSKEASYILTW